VADVDVLGVEALGVGAAGAKAGLSADFNGCQGKQRLTFCRVDSRLDTVTQSQGQH
jgi:hypothetical protein